MAVYWGQLSPCTIGPKTSWSLNLGSGNPSFQKSYKIRHSSRLEASQDALPSSFAALPKIGPDFEGGFFSESAIRFFKSPKKITPNHYPELEI